MSRIRTIKPEFFSSEQIMALSVGARLFFIGTWVFADDSGNIPRSLQQLKAWIFPGDDDATGASIHGMIQELSANDLVVPYTVDGKDYLHITGWRHQRIDKPQKAKYPGPPENSPGAFQEQSTIIRDGGEGKGKERTLPDGRGEDALARATPTPPSSTKPNGASGHLPEAEADRVQLCQDVVAGYNELAEAYRFPIVRDITDRRQKLILDRAKDLVETYEYPTPRAGFEVLFKRVRNSKYLRGETERPWRTDFDFLFRIDSFTSILEGGYEDHKPKY